MTATAKNVTKIAPRQKAKQLDEAVTTAPLSSRAMIVSLNISHFNPAITDKAVTDEVHQTHNVSERSGKYRKNRIDTDAPVWKQYIAARSALRTKYYEMTLPWGQDGSRILTTLLFDKFTEEMRKLAEKVNEAADEFVAAFPDLKAQAKEALNGMYRESDYPTNIAAKFDVRWKFQGLSTADDFRAEISQEHVTEIRKEIEEDLRHTAEEAMKEPYKRLFECINRMVEQIEKLHAPVTAGKKAPSAKVTIQDTLISNLAQLCQILPGLNLTGDERLAELGKRAMAMVQDITAEDIREQPKTRREVHTKAKELQNTMAQFMGPMLASDEE